MGGGGSFSTGGPGKGMHSWLCKLNASLLTIMHIRASISIYLGKVS